MKLLRRALGFASLAVLASGIAGATTILNNVQAATGALSSFSAPPNPNSSTAQFNQFSQTAANAAIVCPSGDVCSTATLYEIDLGLTATTAGSLNLVNGNPTSQNISCFAGTCSGSTATATNGIAAEGTLSLDAFDPNSNDVLALNNAPTFTVATNGVQGVGAGKNNFLTVSTGTTSESGTGTAADPLGEIYQSTDGTWAAEILAYVGSGNVTLNLSLTGASQIGSAPAGVNTANNIDSITGGTVTANYLFSYTETATSSTPEPTTMLLMGSVLLGAGLIRRHRRQS